jgi:hypothetical protein
MHSNAKQKVSKVVKPLFYILVSVLQNYWNSSVVDNTLAITLMYTKRNPYQNTPLSSLSKTQQKAVH